VALISFEAIRLAVFSTLHLTGALRTTRKSRASGGASRT
jgi:hypothetical protein